MIRGRSRPGVRTFNLEVCQWRLRMLWATGKRARACTTALLLLSRTTRRIFAAEPGHTMVALLVWLNVMAITMSVALPVWSRAAKREREEELIFRGRQYARAVGLYTRKYANAYPPSVDVLLAEKFLRKRYKDPMMEDGEFQMLYRRFDATIDSPRAGAFPALRDGKTTIRMAGGGSLGQAEQFAKRLGGTGAVVAVAGTGGIVGVVSRSTEESLRLFEGQTRYSEWMFIHLPLTSQPSRSSSAREVSK